MIYCYLKEVGGGRAPPRLKILGITALCNNIGTSGIINIIKEYSRSRRRRVWFVSSPPVRFFVIIIGQVRFLRFCCRSTRGVNSKNYYRDLRISDYTDMICRRSPRFPIRISTISGKLPIVCTLISVCDSPSCALNAQSITEIFK